MDLLKFVEVMQKQKRQSGGGERKRFNATMSDLGFGDVQSHHSSAITVDVSKNFNFVTNFGTSAISSLMLEYVFEGIFSCLIQFITLRLPMSPKQSELLRRILKLCLMSATFKQKASHEAILIRFISTVRNSPVLQEIVSTLNINLQALGITMP